MSNHPTEFEKALLELVQFDSHQHDKNCGVTITKDPGNCDCNKTELLDAIKAAIAEHIIGEDDSFTMSTIPIHREVRNKLKAEQRNVLYGDKKWLSIGLE